MILFFALLITTGKCPAQSPTTVSASDSEIGAQTPTPDPVETAEEDPGLFDTGKGNRGVLIATIALMGIGLTAGIGWAIYTFVRFKPLNHNTAPKRGMKVPIVLAIGAYLLIFIQLLALTGIASQFVPPDSVWMRLGTTVYHQVLLGAVSLPMIAGFMNKPTLPSLLPTSSRKTAADIGRSLLGYLCIWPWTMLLLAATLFLIKQYNLPDPRTNEMLLMMKEASPMQLTVIAASACVLAPIAEEMYFRGVLQSVARDHLKSPLRAMLIVSAVFTFVHLPFWQDFPSLFALSLVMGYCYERSGRLLVPILIHALFNTTSIIFTLVQLG
ncbi:MAG: CPBP family intramembrane glutamic endopeptidase [Phycisphaerae bacterium]